MAMAAAPVASPVLSSSSSLIQSPSSDASTSTSTSRTPSSNSSTSSYTVQEECRSTSRSPKHSKPDKTRTIQVEAAGIDGSQFPKKRTRRRSTADVLQLSVSSHAEHQDDIASSSSPPPLAISDHSGYHASSTGPSSRHRNPRAHVTRSYTTNSMPPTSSTFSSLHDASLEAAAAMERPALANKQHLPALYEASPSSEVPRHATVNLSRHPTARLNEKVVGHVPASLHSGSSHSKASPSFQGHTHVSLPLSPTSPSLAHPISVPAVSGSASRHRQSGSASQSLYVQHQNFQNYQQLLQGSTTQRDKENHHNNSRRHTIDKYSGGGGISAIPPSFQQELIPPLQSATSSTQADDAALLNAGNRYKLQSPLQSGEVEGIPDFFPYSNTSYSSMSGMRRHWEASHGLIVSAGEADNDGTKVKFNTGTNSNNTSTRLSPSRTTRQNLGSSNINTNTGGQLNRSNSINDAGNGNYGPSVSPRYDAEREAARSNQVEAKIVLLGRQGVGKTSLVHRYMTGQFSSSLPTTIGASFLVKKLIMDGVKVRLQIWDTAGQERFRSMAPMYYRGAHAALLVYDITSEDSLSDIKVWLDELRRNMSSDLIVQIVGHKADLAPTHRKIELDYAKRKIEEWLMGEANAPLESYIPGRDLLSPTQDNAPFRSNNTNNTTATTTTNITNSGSNGAGLTPSALSRTMSNRSRTSASALSETSLPTPQHSSTTTKSSSSTVPATTLPAFKDIGISEVSAKEDAGIEDLFLSIASKLVERKSQIEHDRILRSKNSIMLGGVQGHEKVEENIRGWACC